MNFQSLQKLNFQSSFVNLVQIAKLENIIFSAEFTKHSHYKNAIELQIIFSESRLPRLLKKIQLKVAFKSRVFLTLDLNPELGSEKDFPNIPRISFFIILKISKKENRLKKRKLKSFC